MNLAGIIMPKNPGLYTYSQEIVQKWDL